jgi:hypothetical protein
LSRAPVRIASTAAALSAALAACAPVDPPAVELCKFALARALADPPADPGVFVSQTAETATVELYFTHAGAPTTAACAIRVTDHAVRLRKFTVGGTRVPPETLAQIRADWRSREDAGKLYQL